MGSKWLKLFVLMYMEDNEKLQTAKKLGTQPIVRCLDSAPILILTTFEEVIIMQSLKNIVINGAMILALLLGLTVSASATAAEPSFEEVKVLAEQGIPLGQTVLGSYYKDGQGVRQDYSKALEWFKKAADQNNNFAQFHIGSMYEIGQGVRHNKATAKEWYGKACDNGNQLGCNNYKRLNEQGY